MANAPRAAASGQGWSSDCIPSGCRTWGGTQSKLPTAVGYSPASKIYHVRRVLNDRVENLGEHKTIEAAEQVLRQPYRTALSPARRGARYFYVFAVDISTLSLSDLDAWQRWLRGEAQPAVQGKKSLPTAMQRGIGSLLSRVLGGETQSYDTRSGIFTAG